MPIQHAIWKVGTDSKPLQVGRLASEQQLEEMIVRDSNILSSEWMLIGQQEITNFGGRIDLLAMAPDGSLILVELKRDKTPREIIAQALDYASWVEQLTPERISQIFQRYTNGGNLNDAFKIRFGTDLVEESINQSHQIVIVASELDAATERIITYLNARDVAINALFFQVFISGADQFLSRAWFIDPGETQVNMSTTPSKPRERGPWNGEFYVSYGGWKARVWDEARKFGFISAGGGTWYSNTLRQLNVGDRVWVNIPKEGYVGVGTVRQTSTPIGEFCVTVDGVNRPVLEVLEHAAEYKASSDDPALCDYFVGIDWLDSVPQVQAFKELGLFGNQNTVCKPQTVSWPHTIERLKTVFLKWDGNKHA